MQRLVTKIDPAERRGSWLGVARKTVAGTYDILAITGSMGAMACKKFKGIISKSDE